MAVEEGLAAVDVCASPEEPNVSPTPSLSPTRNKLAATTPVLAPMVIRAECPSSLMIIFWGVPGFAMRLGPCKDHSVTPEVAANAVIPPVTFNSSIV